MVKTRLTPRTVNNYLIVLGKALHLAEEWGDLAATPRIEPLALAPQPIEFLDFEEAGGCSPQPRRRVRVALRPGSAPASCAR